MKVFSLIIIALILFIISSCCEQPKENSEHVNVPAKKDTVKQILMSRETSLSAAEDITAEIKIPTAVCSMCEKNIVDAVKKLDGVVKVSADAKKKKVIVTFNGAKTSTEDIRHTISKAGYDADNIKRDPAAYEKLDDCCKN